MTRTKNLLALLLIFLLIMALSGCSSDIEYIPEATEYSESTAQETLSDLDVTALEDASSEEIRDLREEQLASLRKNGAEADRLADTLTADFPTENPAVPLRVELATADGTTLWLVYEAWVSEDGAVNRRLWLIDQTTHAIKGSTLQH